MYFLTIGNNGSKLREAGEVRINALQLDATGIGDDRPSVFTAVQEQLGLKLEPGRAPIEVLVIDHIEKPAPNE